MPSSILYTTVLAPRQTTEILQEVLLYLKFTKEKASSERVLFPLPSRFLQENPFMSVVKDVFSPRAIQAGKQLQRPFLEIPRRGTQVLSGRLFSTCTEQWFKWYILNVAFRVQWHILIKQSRQFKVSSLAAKKRWVITDLSPCTELVYTADTNK